MSKQDCKVFIGGLSWETTDEKLRRYFENYGPVTEAFVSYDRVTGRPRGFGFVVFEDAAVADKVVSMQHTIDRREVEAKKAVPKEEHPSSKQPNGLSQQRTKKVFVGGLAPTVDEQAFRKYFEQYGQVEDAVVMYDHDNKRPRGFGFVTFIDEQSVENVFTKGVMQTLHDKQIEIKRAVPKDQMPPSKSKAGMYGYGRGYPVNKAPHHAMPLQLLGAQNLAARGYGGVGPQFAGAGSSFAGGATNSYMGGGMGRLNATVGPLQPTLATGMVNLPATLGNIGGSMGHGGPMAVGGVGEGFQGGLGSNVSGGMGPGLAPSSSGLGGYGLDMHSQLRVPTSLPSSFDSSAYPGSYSMQQQGHIQGHGQDSQPLFGEGGNLGNDFSSAFGGNYPQHTLSSNWG